MKSSSGRVLAVLLSAVLVVGAANLAAYAANGSPLLLGKANSATKPTKLANSKGTALSLKSKKGKAPLAVSSDTKVAKLNADQLDGLDSTALQNRPYVIGLTGSSAAGAIAFPIAGVPAGSYLVTYNVNAAVAGAPSYFGCYLRRASAPTTFSLAQLGAASGGNWFVSASGTYTVSGSDDQLYCTTSGTAISVPAAPATAQVTFTRIDGTTTTAATGATPRHAAGKGPLG